jgi:formylglycine-generating enzyme required for sulfatase activity
MGDGGATFTDKNGRKFKSYWTGDRDDKPAHKVTLDSYSMMKYEVTYKDYDFFVSLPVISWHAKNRYSDPT